jgi:hypothetical protein
VRTLDGVVRNDRHGSGGYLRKVNRRSPASSRGSKQSLPPNGDGGMGQAGAAMHHGVGFLSISPI